MRGKWGHVTLHVKGNMQEAFCLKEGLIIILTSPYHNKSSVYWRSTNHEPRTVRIWAKNWVFIRVMRTKTGFFNLPTQSRNESYYSKLVQLVMSTQIEYEMEAVCASLEKHCSKGCCDIKPTVFSENLRSFAVPS